MKTLTNAILGAALIAAAAAAAAADGKFLIPVGKKVRIVFARGTAASRGDARK